ncbi:3-keto-disaccharide hydrolase [Spirosoma gilvum]
MPYGILISLFLLSGALLSPGAFLSRLHQPTQPSASTGWRPLFNGTNLTGWKHVGKGSMLVENGLIRGKGGMGLLYYSKEKFSNCTLRIVYKMQKENSNAGVFIRIPVEPREEWMPVHYGYEVQIDNHPETSDEDEYHVTGTLYSLTKPLAKPGKPGPQWNTMDITLDGPRTIVYVNGVKVTDYREGAPVPARKFDFEPYRGLRPNIGYIGLQNHGEHDIVYFKEVSVKPLR